MKSKKLILVTNDDGIYAPGVDALRKALAPLGQVIAVVPDHERSAASHSLTLHKPLRLRQVEGNLYSLNGTPADCVRFSVLELFRKKNPDLVVSGVNSGVNLGEDVIYSGTVAGAVEGALLNIPSIAVSRSPSQEQKDFLPAAKFTKRLAEMVLKNGLPEGVCLNVNVPDRFPDNGYGDRVRVTLLGHRLYGKKITTRRDPRGHEYYWLLAKSVLGVSIPESDVEALKKRCISVTPLALDWTAHGHLSKLRKWKF